MINKSEALSHLKTAGDWVRWAASRFNEAELFFGHGTEDAWDEAVNLVLTVLHLPPQTHPNVFHAAFTPSESQSIANVIRATY